MSDTMEPRTANLGAHSTTETALILQPPRTRAKQPPSLPPRALCGVRRCCANLQIFRRCNHCPVTMQSCKYSALLSHDVSMQTCGYLCIVRASASPIYVFTRERRSIVLLLFLLFLLFDTDDEDDVCALVATSAVDKCL